MSKTRKLTNGKSERKATQIKANVRLKFRSFHSYQAHFLKKFLDNNPNFLILAQKLFNL